MPLVLVESHENGGSVDVFASLVSFFLNLKCVLVHLAIEESYEN